MRNLIFTITILSSIAIMTGCQTLSLTFDGIPPGKVAVMIGQDNQTIQEYLKTTGHVPAGFMTYTSIQVMDGVEDWSKDYGSGKFNAEEFIGQYPGHALQIGLYMVDGLKDTYEGKYDGNIDRLAQWLKKVDAPVFLRIGYEFDGPHNHYDPEDYKKAYTYIVDKLKRAEVKNARYVWHSFASSGGRDIREYYPGDGYVDWIGISYFDQPHELMMPVVRFAKEKKKPLMIAESSPAKKKTSHGRVIWESWYKPYFRFIKNNDIRIVSYINSHWDAMPMWKDWAWGDARIEANEYIKDAWLQKMQEDRYTFQFKQ